MPSPDFTLVVPCFNEEAGIRNTIAQLRAALSSAGKHEILVVDDGSTDRTPAILAELQAEGALRVVRHGENRGYGAALKTGLRHCRTDIVAIIDADGTYPADRLPELVAACAEADMAVGARTMPGAAHPIERRLPKAVLRRWATWLVGRNIPDMNSGLRAFRKDEVIRFLRVLPDGFSFTTTITIAMMRSGLDVRFVPVPYAARLGSSKIRPIADFFNFVQLICRTGMYFAPLRALAPVIVALLCAFAVSLGYDVFVLDDLTEKTVILLLFALNTALFALLADMLDKRLPR